jgi:hypothetical protein
MKRSGKYVVVRVRNDHDAMTVRDPSRNSTFHVVECEDEDIDGLLDDLDIEDAVRLDLRRIGCRGNAWCAEDATRLDEEADPVGADPDSLGGDGRESPSSEGNGVDPSPVPGDPDATGTSIPAVSSRTPHRSEVPAGRSPTPRARRPSRGGQP